MASRGTYLSRSTGRPEPGQQSSITAPAPTTSKIPTSSWFSRGKKERPLNTPQTRSRALPDDRVEVASTAIGTAVPHTSRKPRGHGLGITASTSSSHESPTQEQRHRNVLRRKTTSQDQRAYYTRTQSSSASSYGAQVQRHYETASTPDSKSKSGSQSILGLAMPSASTSTSFLPSSTMMNPGQATSSSRMAVYQNRKAPHTLSTQNLPPPTPSFAQSSGSSTRYSESPSSLSHTSTPTSMSSYSPSISLPSKSPLKLRQSSPTRSRPPVTTRWKKHNNHDVDVDARGLAAVRESVTSSSSSSTVKGTERGENNHPRQTAYRLSPPPPSPPVRGFMTKNALSRIETAAHITVNQTNTRRQATYSSAPQQEETNSLESSTAPSHQISSPPPRPSREGTPKLDSYMVPSPVIHSNLTRLATTGHKRRESIERTGARTELPVTSRSGLGRSPSNPPAFSARPSRRPSPSPSSVSSTLVSPSQTRLNDPIDSGNPPSGHSNSAVELQVKDAHTQSANSSRSSSRFGLFSRRTRSPMERASHEAIDRATKKGPVAGTGHEGYGKYAKRGRSSSMSTSASRGRSTSTTGTANSSLARTPLSRKSSTTSRGEKDMDDFLLERLAPVYITGGGMVDNHDGVEMYRTSSGESSSGIVAHDIPYTARPPFAVSDAAQTPAISTRKEDSRSLRRELRTIPHGFGHRSDDRKSTGESSRSSSHSQPTLAARRSLHRSQLFKEAEPMKLPTPINTRVLAPSPMDSLDTVPPSTMTTDSTTIISDELAEGREGNWLKPKNAGKRARSPMKWNFFQRALGSPKKSSDHAQRTDIKEFGELPATVSRLPNSRPLPYYAMLDMNEQEGVENMTHDTDIDRTMQNDIGISQDPPEIIKDEPSPLRQSNKTSMLLPSPPTFPTEFANAYDQAVQTRADLQQRGILQGTVRAADEPPKPRAPRLQQIGRIPRVVSKRDRLHNPPPQSFSRPFARPSPQDDQAISTHVVESGPKGSETAGLASNTGFSQSDLWHSEALAKPEYTTSRDEFLMFPPRKFSQVSASSSSGAGSFAAAIATTAIVPEPYAAPGEDEVWNEYNDFLDTVEPPAPLPESSVTPFELGHNDTRMTPAPLHIRKDSQPDNPTTLAMSTKDVAAAHGLPSPPPMSKLLASRQSTETASSPMSFTDFFAGYESRNRASAASKHQSLSSGSHYSTDSIPGKESNMYGKRSTQIMAEKTEGTSNTQSNLRFSALMTSRWLSFGRVLFSPAHNEIQSNRQDRVLVLDGLGNDDWSFYCSLTYPHATIYNLSPFQTQTTTGSSSSASVQKKHEAAGAHYYDSPSNHRQIYHTSIAHPFPFPKAFFTAAVFRFPVAGSETAYASAIAEFKRVLQPGGYLELSILDLDMVNMGNRARRAVRALKLDMQAANPDVSLKPNSDNIQKLLGRRGFENLKSCMVDVPVAGHISSSRAGSFDEEAREMSLGDMLKDESRRGDESITKMVSKVGRWWYSRCYEVGVLPPPTAADDDDGEGGEQRRSIWDDTQLLKECEKRETGLKLLICYAQKPVGMKRRTVSM